MCSQEIHNQTVKKKWMNTEKNQMMFSYNNRRLKHTSPLEMSNLENQYQKFQNNLSS